MSKWLEKLFNEWGGKGTPLLGADPSPIFIYGTGTMAQDVYRVLIDHGFRVMGYLDHMEGTTPNIQGVPVYKPEDAPVTKKSTTSVVMGVHNSQADTAHITETLKASGFNRIISTVELYDSYGEALGVRYWLTARKFYQPFGAVIDGMLEFWADDKSKSIYRSILEFRLSGDATLLPPPDLETQYHPLDVPAPKTPLRFIDCGAYDGDTLAEFIRVGLPIEAVVAFEPDIANFKRLANFVSQNQSSLTDISLWPCGVYSAITSLAFETGKGMASGVSESGKNVVACVDLDDALPTFKPTLIKMDIEGAEYDALMGAQGLIKDHLPTLAICLYHRPEHLWQIPLLIERLSGDRYHYFLRSHAFNDFELVLYAVPK